MQQTQRQRSRTDTKLMAIGSTDLGGAEVPARVLVVPWGEVASSSGSFLVDAASADAVVASFQAGGNDLPIDYEHQTLGGEFTSPDGRAPAAGWIKSLEAVEGEGIFAAVEWTERGKTVLAAKEYRYLSPVALVDRESGQMVSLHSAALTNKPAIPAMRPIVNTNRSQADGDDELAELAVPASAIEQLRGQLDIEAAASAEEVLVCAGRRLGELTERIRQEEASGLVAAAIAAGKCTESQRDWAESLAMRDPQGFESWQRCAPVVVHTGRLEAPSAEPHESRRLQSVVNRARSEYRRHRELHGLTSEQAYVTNALREAGLSGQQ